uniref:Glycosyltransferase n=1 Tax=Oryza barthii TaxID=65489 RepID=A0A0D3F5A3_9ORYZ
MSSPSSSPPPPPPAHAVFFPFPVQGHVASALHLAKLLHARGGIHITFVHSERSRRPGQFKDVLDEAAAAGEPATCVVSDMDHILLAAGEMGLPTVVSWVPSACSLLASQHYQQLIDRGLVPLKDAEPLSNGHLDSTVVDWVPGMPSDMRLRDFGPFVHTTDRHDAVLTMYLFYMDCLRTMPSAIVLNTFDDLDGDVVAALSRLMPPAVYTVGPLPQLAAAHVAGSRSPVDALGASLWPEDGGCLEWLRGKPPRSVLYVNFGSIVVVTREQLGGNPIDMLPREFAEETKGRGYVTSWCPQEALLRDEAIGAFLTHCGWNSMLDGICNGVPMLCYPLGADQQTNCRYARTEWRIGVEVDEDIRRESVARMVREVMGGERGEEMRQCAVEWKEKAAVAVAPGGTSWVNLQRLISEVFCSRKDP